MNWHIYSTYLVAAKLQKLPQRFYQEFYQRYFQNFSRKSQVNQEFIQLFYHHFYRNSSKILVYNIGKKYFSQTFSIISTDSFRIFSGKSPSNIWWNLIEFYSNPWLTPTRLCLRAMNLELRFLKQISICYTTENHWKLLNGLAE